MKKLINAVEDILSESLDGFAAAHGDMSRWARSINTAAPEI